MTIYKIGRILKPHFQYQRDEFVNKYAGRKCFCNPPFTICDICMHPGNPINQEDERCWHVTSNVTRVSDTVNDDAFNKKVRDW